MNFQELGLTLQQERELKGLTIKEVMESTKISRVILLALESGDRSALPHPVYTKGFVKSYARLLGLDAEELAMVVDREYQMEPTTTGLSYDVSPHAEKAFLDTDAPAARKRSVWPSILIVLVLCCAILVLVLNLNKGGMKEITSPEPSVGTSVAPVNPAELPAPEAGQPEGEEGIDMSSPTESVTPAESSESTTQSGVADSVAQPRTTESTPPPPVEAKPIIPPASVSVVPDMTDDEVTDSQDTNVESSKYAHVLVIRATSDKGCWIGVWRGDETAMARDFVLTKGEPLRLMFNSARRIRIGNVSGVIVTYNGKPYSLDSAKGNIQTLLFGM